MNMNDFQNISLAGDLKSTWRSCSWSITITAIATTAHNNNYTTNITNNNTTTSGNSLLVLVE